jgi:transposase InsO family protein
MKLGNGVGRELSPDAATYTYAGMSYANPDAVTQVANGTATSSYAYDNEAPHYLVRDRDRIYGSVVRRRLRAMGIRDKPTAPASPWQNGFAERLIGSIRRECVDHIIVLGEMHLRRVLKSYADYYNPVS